MQSCVQKVNHIIWCQLLHTQGQICNVMAIVYETSINADVLYQATACQPRL